MKRYLWDGIALTGVAMIGAGLYLVHLPSALVAVGAIFVLLALAGAKRGAGG